MKTGQHPSFKQKTGSGLKFILFFIIILLSFTYLFQLKSFASKSDQELRVNIIKPKGNDIKVEEVKQFIVSFNQPMVPLGRMDQKPKDAPLKVEPYLPNGQFRWLNTTTLAYQLKEKLPKSTRFTIFVPKEIKSLLGSSLRKKVEAQFITERISLKRKKVLWIKANLPKLLIIFNQPVDITSLKEKTLFYWKGEKHKLRIIPVKKINDKKIPPNTAFYFLPETSMPLKSCGRLVIEPGLRSLEGPEPNIKRIEVSFKSYGDFRLEAISYWLSNKYDTRRNYKIDNKTTKVELSNVLPDYSPYLYFSSPVKNRDYINSIIIYPKVKAPKESYTIFEYYRKNPLLEHKNFSLPDNLSATTSYKIRFKENFYDCFGRRYKGPKEIIIKTGHFSPLFDLKGSQAIIERNGPWQYPLVVRNIPKIDVQYKIISSPDDYNILRMFGKNLEFKKMFKDVLLKVIKPKTAFDETFIIPLDLKTLLGKESLVASLVIYLMPEGIKENRWLFAQITNLGITYKHGFFNSLAWITNIEKGTPVNRVRLSFYKNYNHELWSGLSDENGIVIMPGAKDLDPERRINRYNNKGFLITASKGDELSLMELKYHWRRGIEPWQFNLETERLYDKSNWLAYAFTDTPIYLPGKKVHFKIFVKKRALSSLKLPAPDMKINIKVINPKGKKVYEIRDISLSEYGTAWAEFNLSKKSALGRYSIIVFTEKDTTYEAGSFLVEEYKLAPFKIELASEKNEYLPNDTPQIEIKASYHFGGPLKNREGRFTASLHYSEFKPKESQFANYIFSDNTLDKSKWISSYTFYRSSFSTNNNGYYKLNLSLPISRIKNYSFIDLEASIPDERGKNIAGHTRIKIHPACFYLGLKPAQWLLEAGDPAIFNLIAITPDGLFQNNKEVTLKLFRLEYYTIREKGVGSFYNYRSTPHLELISYKKVYTKRVPIEVKMTLPKPGSYIIQAISYDKNKREVKAGIKLYAIGKGAIGWERFNHDRIDLIPDKESYLPGDSATILVKNPYDKANALITVEREGIIDYFIQKLVGGAATIKLPIKRSYFPGVYISVTLIKGRVSQKIDPTGVDLGKPSFKLGYLKIKVDDPAKTLDIKIKINKNEFRPNERAKINIKVNNHNRKGIKSEVALAVVDEAVLQLVPHAKKNYDVGYYFARILGLDVITFETLTHLIGRRHYGLKGVNPGGGGGFEGIGDILLRKDFKAVAYWNPSIITNKNGEATVFFQLPDNLTSWRIIVVASDKNNRFGLKTSLITVNKPLIIKPALPNFLVTGDILDASFIIHNRTKQKGEVLVSLEGKNVEFLEKTSSKLNIPPESRKKVSFQLRAKKGKELVLKVKAVMGNEADGVKVILPLKRKVFPQISTTYGTFTKEMIYKHILFPKEMEKGSGELKLIFTTSLLSQLDKVIDYINNYPYLCWEQKLTKAVIFSDYIKLKPYFSSLLTHDVPVKVIKRTLKEASRYQALNGGFGYWGNRLEKVDPYLSAYTGLAFYWLKSNGFEPPKDVFTQLIKYLDRLMRYDKEFPNWYTKRMKLNVQVISAYLLSLENRLSKSLLEKIIEEKEGLDLFGLGFLFMTIYRELEDNSLILNDIRQQIINHSDITTGEFQFKESVDVGFSHLLYSNIRTNCLLLTSFLNVEPKSEVSYKLLHYIITSRKAGHWLTTQENIFCLNCIKDYASIFEQEMPKFKLMAYLNNKFLGQIEFNSLKRKPEVIIHKIIPLELGEKKILSIKKVGRGRVYYGLELKWSPCSLPTKPVNNGFIIKKNLFKEELNGNLTELKNKIKLKQGDKVEIHLTLLLPASRNFIVIDDPLPACFETININLATASREDAKIREETETDFWFYHKEMRKDRVLFFADRAPAGKYLFKYKVQVVAKGDFTMLPCHVEEMYSPAVFGQGVYREVEVK
ncbi:MAG: hypothetical protein JRI44_03645 [Deltaproteobacteria bacterium]|nr:hypothetical protein [Deltaproteobacteria bacterium]